MYCGGAAESVDVIGLERATRYQVFGSFALKPICLRSGEGISCRIAAMVEAIAPSCVPTLLFQFSYLCGKLFVSLCGLA